METLQYASSSTNPPSMMSGHIYVHGGQFNQSIYIDGGGSAENSSSMSLSQRPLEILKDAVAPAAFHNSGARFDPPKCHPNTRVAILQAIKDWALVRTLQTVFQYIMWLTGAAGAGKSSIAQTLIELCLSEGLILASFFFSKSDSSRNHIGSFVATLAYQIYQQTPLMRSQILKFIEDDPLIFTRSMDYQFNTLIAIPLHNLLQSGKLPKSQSRRIIVIDGLDECLDRNGQQEILTTISSAVRRLTLPVMFLIASRPEHEIKAVFNSKKMSGIHTRINLDDDYEADHDIALFLRHHFDELKENHPFRRYLPESWPETEVIDELVKKSSGQFIYAATVVRYVQSLRHRPNQRLNIVRNLLPAQRDLPFAELDVLYHHIFSSVDQDTIDKVLRAIGYILLCSTLNVSHGIPHMEAILSFETGDMDILLCDLAALIVIDEENTRGYHPRKARILHASLQDFLLDPARSRQFYINIEAEKTRHVENCLLRIHEGDEWIGTGLLLSFFEIHAKDCEISTNLIRQASSLSLLEVFDSHYYNWNKIAEKFALAFFQLLQRIRLTEVGRSYVHLHHLHVLDEVFSSEMEYYYSAENLLFLALMTCYAGTHPLIPIISSGSRIFLFPSDIVSETGDNLTLAWNWDSLVKASAVQGFTWYHREFSNFLLDPNRSGPYALASNSDKLSKAAWFCLHFLQTKIMPWIRGNDTDTPPRGDTLRTFDFNDDEHPELMRAEDGSWRWKCRWDKQYEKPNTETWHRWSKEAYPLILGYLIYLLPLCKRYEPLIDLCESQNISLGIAASISPIRTERVS